jgi:aminoglycoside phosphotransferase (APT) family kinase protein
MNQEELACIFDKIGISYKTIKILEKGWSQNMKCVLSADNSVMCASFFSKNMMDRKKEIFEIQKVLHKNGVKVAKPEEIYTYEDYGILVAEYLDGVDGEEAVVKLGDEDCYDLGFQAGQELRKIHSIDAPENLDDWSLRKSTKSDKYLELYKKAKYKLENEEEIIEFIKSNYYVMMNRPNMLQHDDFHLGNLIYKGNILQGVIDFDLCDYGDPYHDLIKCGNISATLSENFCKGQIDGYFYPNKPDDNFWLIYSVYGAMSVISTIVWLERFHPQRFEEGMKGIYKMLSDHDNFKEIIPRWYNNK